MGVDGGVVDGIGDGVVGSFGFLGTGTMGRDRPGGRGEVWRGDAPLNEAFTVASRIVQVFYSSLKFSFILPLSEPRPTPERPALTDAPGLGVPAATPTLTLLAS